MRYKKLGSSDLNVSVVGLGTWAMGNDFWGKVDDDMSIYTIQKAIDCGINLIDTAPAYGDGHAERIVGKAIKGRRDSVIIATKCGTLRDGKNFIRSLKPKDIRKQIENSLRFLDIDFIDLYQIHWPDPSTPLEESVNELLKLKEEGKFRWLGVSNFNIDLLNKIMSLTEIVSLQPPYSLLQRDTEEVITFCHEKGLGVLSYGSLGAGVLSGKFKEQPKFEEGDNRSKFYPFFREPLWSKSMQLVDVLRDIAARHDKPVAHVAINWVNQQDRITTALVGAKTPEQAEQNAMSASWELSQDEIDEINTAYDRIFGK